MNAEESLGLAPQLANDLAAREGLSVQDACRVAGLGRSTIYEAIARGALKSRKCGRRRLILREDLMDMLANLPASGERGVKAAG
jgi:excisionase family DNA binding protein